jgi:hypothetical protein
MVTVYKLLGALAFLMVTYVATIFIASESGGEVVELFRPSEDGRIDTVRVWIVDAEDGAMIEHGAPDDAWMKQLTVKPTLRLRRQDQVTTYNARVAPKRHMEYHRLRREKYGFSDRLIDWLSFKSAASCSGVPIYLSPKS